MTDAEYNEFYERKKMESVRAALGNDVKFKPAVEEHTHFMVKKDSNWRDAPRGLMSGKDYDLAMKYVAQYNRDKYKNGGKIVTYIEETPAEIPPVVK